MRGIRVRKGRGRFSICALQYLAETLDRRGVRAIAQLCELAASHPGFGGIGQPGADDYFIADEATDMLSAIFDEYFVEDRPENPPRFVVDSERATITVTLYQAHGPRDPDETHDVGELDLKLVDAPDARN